MRMSWLGAPMAILWPISRVRSVTETSIMFMIPIPPTIRLTEATAVSRALNTRVVSTRVSIFSDTFLTRNGSVYFCRVTTICLSTFCKDYQLLNLHARLSAIMRFKDPKFFTTRTCSQNHTF